jgi:hypothetical protein
VTGRKWRVAKKPPIPPQVAEFVRGQIDSVEELEVLLLLFREPERAWTEAEVNARIRSSLPSILKRLNGLVSVGAATASGEPPRFRFAPRTPQIAAAVEGLAEAYRDYRTTVIQLIFELPSTQVLGFAKAFEIKKKP